MFNGGQIYDNLLRKTLYNTKKGERLCIFLERKVGLLLRSPFKNVYLFPDLKTFDTVISHKLPMLRVFKAKNLTMPDVKTDKKYVKVIFKDVFVDYAFITAVFSGIFFGTLIVVAISVVIIWKCKCNTVDARDIPR